MTKPSPSPQQSQPQSQDELSDRDLEAVSAGTASSPQGPSDVGLTPAKRRN
ncbi:hypothetical protein [Novispirillum itersonii]|uniref:Uncharacterized protein n=1 Tax=Novispirillum itersonii TaxID=189 RepID=A0A7X0DLT8_NOVIT|nr:hypothetical protein [Novispirillum itersonii]MBB6210330.1 hypothetical protein [Novispirillum itersonii]